MAATSIRATVFAFVVGDLVKGYAAAAALPPAHRWVRHLRSNSTGSA